MARKKSGLSGNEDVDLIRRAWSVNLECTRSDDHDFENCQKCLRLKRRIYLAFKKFRKETLPTGDKR